MKRAIGIICMITILCLAFSQCQKAEASGEESTKIETVTEEKGTSGEAKEKEESLYGENAYQVVNHSFEVKTNVNFPDLVKKVYNQKTGKYDEFPHEYQREILIAARVGFIEGYEDGTFQPDNSITRAEFIKMLMGLATNRTFNFSAIPSTYQNWAGKFVTLAEMQGIIEKGKYTEQQLEQPITRLEVVCMLAKVQIKMKGIPQSQLGHLIYTDIDELTEEEKGLLLHAASYDLLEGMKDNSINKFEPKKNITRAETARALVRIY